MIGFCSGQCRTLEFGWRRLSAWKLLIASDILRRSGLPVSLWLVTNPMIQFWVYDSGKLSWSPLHMQLVASNGKVVTTVAITLSLPWFDSCSFTFSCLASIYLVCKVSANQFRNFVLSLSFPSWEIVGPAFPPCHCTYRTTKKIRGRQRDNGSTTGLLPIVIYNFHCNVLGLQHFAKHHVRARPIIIWLASLFIHQ